MTQTDTPALLFYGQPQPLDEKKHKGLRLKPDPDYAFAREANAIPLAVAEFAPAAAHYPIVFIGEPDKPRAVAITGIRAGQNLFVEADGSWRKHSYIPAYVRRYPFILMRDRDGKRGALCVDPKSSRVTTKGKAGEPLLKDGKLAPAGEKALAFCVDYDRRWEAGVKALPLLAELDLLKPIQATVTLASGEKRSVTGFRIIDEERLRKLSDEEFLKLRHADLLAAAYCSLLSQARWADLGARA